jgi:hypothetical protein
MKSGEIISPGRLSTGEMTHSAKIAREIVHRCVETFKSEDREAAVDRALTKFYIKLKEETKQELKLYQLKKIGSSNSPR